MSPLSTFLAALMLPASHVLVHATPFVYQASNSSLRISASQDPPKLVPVNFASGTGACSKDQKGQIRTELSWAYEMAKAAYDDSQYGDYYETFFSEDLRNQDDFGAKITERYRRISDVLSGTSADYHITVTCDETKAGCWKKGWMAGMSDNTQVMNVCQKWFDTVGGLSEFTEKAISLCDDKWMDLRFAQRTKSSIFVHEIAHTSYAMNEKSGSRDVAYGYNACTALAAGEFDRSCVPYKEQPNKATKQPPPPEKIICPKENSLEEGLCPAEMSARNADTYSFVAAGVFFSKRCNRNIPHPSAAGGAVKRAMKSCPLVDFIVWDGDDESSSHRVAGYAHFGDSYASGMGTGITTGDKCRIGSNNYGDLLYKFLDDKSVVYEGPLSCSGDTTDQLMQKIDSWSTAADTTFATLTIGGNDVGFSDLVWYCVITPNTYYWGSTNRKKCEKAQKDAFDMIKDTSGNGLVSKMSAAYLKILQKAADAGSDLELYVTGYPIFFNQFTEDCKHSSFHYWWGGYKPVGDGFLNRLVYLTKKLRSELAELVYHVNTAIIDAVDTANNKWGATSVRFIPIANSFDTSEGQIDHRWCADEGIHEPNADREDTWFFLSGWKDIGYSEASFFGSTDSAGLLSMAQEREEIQALMQAGEITLPDATSCAGVTTISGADPWEWWQCRMSEAIAEDPNGEVAQSFNAAQDALANGDAESQDVSWWIPTRQIKTFHPRTRGMYAFRDAILEQMQLKGLI